MIAFESVLTRRYLTRQSEGPTKACASRMQLVLKDSCPPLITFHAKLPCVALVAHRYEPSLSLNRLDVELARGVRRSLDKM